MITEEVQYYLFFKKFRAVVAQMKIQCRIFDLAVSILCTEEGKDPNKEIVCDQVI